VTSEPARERTVVAARAVAASPAEHPRRETTGLAWGAVAGALGALVAYAVWLGRGLPLLSDEWDIVGFHYNGHYLTPYNGHLSLVPVAIYRTLFDTVGLQSSTPYRVAGLVCYAAVVLLLFHYCRSRVGPAAAAVFALALAWFSQSQLTLLYGFLLNFTIPLAVLLVIWGVHDRAPRGRDAAGGALLLVALVTSSVGLIVAVSVLVDLAVRRAPARRFVPYAIALAIWLAWYAKYHEPIRRAPAGAVARYAWRQFFGTFRALGAGWTPGGVVLLAGFVALVWFAATRWSTWNARATGALVGWLTFVALTALTRTSQITLNPPDAGRYVWIGAFFAFVVVAECVRTVPIPWTLLGVALVVVALSGAALTTHLRQQRADTLAYGQRLRAPLAAVEAIPDRIDPAQILPLNLIPVRARDYLAAIRAVGSPYPHPTFASLGNETGRRDADTWMLRDLAIRVAPVREAVPAAGCVPARGTTVTVGSGGRVVVRAAGDDVAVRVRRFERRFALPPVGTVDANDAGAVAFPRDRSDIPWHLEVAGPVRSLEVCTSGGTS
jgi:hypothetical protein